MKSRRRIATSRPNTDQLHQGFATNETGLNGDFAQQQFQTAHVRRGSKADISTVPIHVRYSPESRHPTQAVIVRTA
jgi:hypothetical protein